MTVQISSIEDALRDAVLSAGSNERVIFFTPNAPRPKLPYTTIQTLTNGEEINDWNDFDNDEEVDKYYGYRDFIYTLNFYGDNARQEANTVLGNIRKTSIRDKLREDANTSILNTTTPANVNVLIDDEFEKRFLFEITLNVPAEDGTSTDDIGYYNKVDVEWTNRPPSEND